MPRFLVAITTAALAAAVVVGAAIATDAPIEVAEAVPAQAPTLEFTFGFDADVNAPPSCANEGRRCGTRGDPGTSHGIGSTQVPGHLVGATCTAVVHEQNNQSKHPGTTLQVTSATVLTFNGVEDNGFNQYSGSITLGDSVGVVVTLGVDKVTSLEGTVTVSCPPPATTTVPPTTVPTTSSTTPTPTTPTVPPVVPPTSVPPTTAPTATPTTQPEPETSSRQARRCPPGSHDLFPNDERLECAANEESG